MPRTSPSYIGSYRLLNIVHTGQNCHIWQAYDDQQQRIVGIKTLLDRFQKDREQINLLRWEYIVGHMVRDPRIIEVYSFDIDRGTAYVSMEWFSAPNLKNWINEGVEKLAYRLPTIIEKAADALGHFHQAGWVHRDVKPDNFLVTEELELKLIDFALARRRRKKILRLITPRMKVQGTRSYMSPEQIRGEPPEIHADIYSFGCVMHELLAGRPPFTGVSSNDLLNKHLHSTPPSLEALNQNVTPEFAQLVRRLIAKNPADRPQSMGDFIGDFRATRMFKVPPKPPQEK
ncbi:MAG: serine/threonine protein kinase [Pirellulales bacterium]|nr:serine/threonine protein kinase [Pirellulales bacterium]